MPAEKHDCSGEVWGSRAFNTYHCTKNATRHEEGKWWCAIRAPSCVAARKTKADEKYDTERARYRALSDRAEELSRRAGTTVQVDYSNGRRSESAVVIGAEQLAAILTEAGR